MLLVGTPQLANTDAVQCMAALSVCAPALSRRISAKHDPRVRALALLRELLADPGAQRALRVGARRRNGAPAPALKEQTDAEQVSKWAVTLLSSTIRAPPLRETLFFDTALPMLRNIAFKGREAELIAFASALSDAVGFLQPDACWCDLLKPLPPLKSAARHALDAFERKSLWARVRQALEGVLADRAYDYASVPFVASFAHALCFAMWIETSAALLKRIDAQS